MGFLQCPRAVSLYADLGGKRPPETARIIGIRQFRRRLEATTRSEGIGRRTAYQTYVTLTAMPDINCRRQVLNCR